MYQAPSEKLKPFKVRGVSKTRLYAQRFGTVEKLMQHRTAKGEPLSQSTVRMLSNYVAGKFEATGPVPQALDYPRATIDSYKNFVHEALQNLKWAIDVDVGVAVLLTLATNLRSGEISQLRFEHLEPMMAGRLVPIQIKRRHEFVYIDVNERLLRPYLAVLQRLRPGRLLTKSVSFINRDIRKRVYVDPSIKLVGLRLLRKINSKLLLDVSDLNTVRAFNRHRDEQVTAAHYLIPSSFNVA